MGHPIIATWVLGGIAILLTIGSGHKEEADVEHEESTAHTASEGVIAGSEGSIDTVVTKHEKSIVQLSVSSKQPETAASEAAKTEELTKIKEAAQKAEFVEADKKNPEEVQASAPEAVKVPLEIATENSVEKVSKAVVPSDNKDSEDTLKLTTDLGQATAEEMLLMAREAYWNNGLDEAAQIYKKLIEMEPKVLEYRGELGNVFWKQGYPKKAAELYSDIAIPMIDNGDSDRVANMIGFIGLFYPDRAAEILKRIQLDKVNSQ